MGPKGTQQRRPAGSPASRRARHGALSKPVSDDPSRSSAPFLPPLRPHPTLFRILIVVLALWVGFLLYLYFATVYPHRKDVRPIEPVKSALAPSRNPRPMRF